MLLLMLAAQAATADTPTRFSILADPCASERRALDDDIVVCGSRLDSARIPLPNDRAPPNRPLPSNPDANGMGAALAADSPCATRSEGCQTGVDIFGMGTALVRTIGKVAGIDSCCEEPDELTNPFRLIGDMVRGAKRGPGKAERARRMAIPLDPAVPLPAPAPLPAGAQAPVARDGGGA